MIFATKLFKEPKLNYGFTKNKRFFGSQMTTFYGDSHIDAKLTQREKEILFIIGLPTNAGLAEEDIMIPNLEILENRYIRFGSKKDEEECFTCIDTQTRNIVRKFYTEDYEYLNTDLEAYLYYVYIDSDFFANIRGKETLGKFYGNEERYANELKKRFLACNSDVNIGLWGYIVEELGYGLI